MNRQAARSADPDLDARLQLAVGWSFRDHSLLDLALTHRSFCAERGIEASNERLEFLGDSVLGFVVTTFVYAEYPQLPEGDQAARRRRARRRLLNWRPHRPPRCGSAVRTHPAVRPSPRSSPMEAVMRRVPRRRLEAARSSSPPRVRSAAGHGPGGSDYKERGSRARRAVLDQPSAQIDTFRPLQAILRLLLLRAVYGTAGTFKKAAEQVAARRRGSVCSSAKIPPRRSDGCPSCPREVVRRDLEREVVGKKVKNVEAPDARFGDTTAAAPIDHREEDRRGLRRGSILRLDGDDVLMIHLGMSGQLLRKKSARADGEARTW
jgi:hypothetical protein